MPTMISEGLAAVADGLMGRERRRAVGRSANSPTVIVMFSRAELTGDGAVVTLTKEEHQRGWLTTSYVTIAPG
jgi:hypothetical protein